MDLETSVFVVQIWGHRPNILLPIFTLRLDMPALVADAELKLVQLLEILCRLANIGLYVGLGLNH